ncbi:SDR family oxidoreductase [Salinibacter sp.]|uniref:SDR family oxidoreductase n=1 Tax=Salinibacter sp. TaxID=2065818 RepID=UPI0021E988B1|nr:NmrA family NAD(P)-binding protein [Salinibacter sp.]
MSDTDVLVIGGTGTVGSAVVRRLVDRGAKPRVMTRSPESAREDGPETAQYAYGDLTEPETLPPLFEGVEKLYLLTPLHPNEAKLGICAVEAAEESSVSRVVYHSIHNVEADPAPRYHEAKMKVTDSLRESDLGVTLIRPNNFFQNDLLFREPIMEKGVYPQPIGNVGLNRVDVRDIADAAVNALLEPGHEGKTYPVVGPDTLTGPEVAETYSRHLPHQVRYGGNDLGAWTEQAGEMLPEWVVGDFQRNYQFFQEQGLRASREELDHQSEVLGREPRPFDSFVQEVVARWSGEGSEEAREA